MSEFIFKNNKNICKEQEVVLQEECLPVKQPVPDNGCNPPSDDPYYDENLRKYFVRQVFFGDQKFISTKEIKNDSLQDDISAKERQIKTRAKQRIVNFFNLKSANVSFIKSNIETRTAGSNPEAPVEFLVSVDKTEFDKRKDDNTSEPFDSLEDAGAFLSVVFNGTEFKKMLDNSIEKLETFAKFQSYMYSFDKITILKSISNEPFYISLLTQRLKEFKKEFFSFMKLNDFDIDGPYIIEKIEIFFENLDVLSIKGFSCGFECGHDIKLKKGVQEFLNKGFLKDVDLINLIYNLKPFNDANLANISWIDSLLSTIPNLNLQNIRKSKNSATDCFSNFDSLTDYILEEVLSFTEKLEYAFQKKSSTEFANFLDSIPQIFDSTKPGNLEDKLTEVFVKNRSDLQSMERENPDDIVSEIKQKMTDFKGTDEDLIGILELFSPSNLKKMFEEILSCLPKLFSFDDFSILIFNNIFENIDILDITDVFDKLPNGVMDLFEQIVLELQFPWEISTQTTGYILELCTGWYESLLANFSLILKAFNLPDLPDINFGDFTYIDQSSLYEIIKINFPEISFPKISGKDLRLFELDQEFNILEFDFSGYYSFLKSLDKPGFPEESLDFSNFRLPSFKLPSFNFSNLKMLDMKNLFEFIKINLGNISIPDIKFPDFQLDKILNLEQKIVFMKAFHESVILSLPEIKGFFDFTFKNPFNFASNKTPAENPTQTILEFDFNLEETYKMLSLKFSKIFLPFNMDRNQMSFFLNGFPDLNFIGDFFSAISLPNLKLDKASSFFEMLDINLDLFEFKSLRIPSLPDIPSISFNIIKVIKEQLFNVLMIAIKKLIASIINILVGSLKVPAIEFSCEDLFNFTESENGFFGGFDNFVKDFLCEDKNENITPNSNQETANINSQEASTEAAKQMIGNENISNEDYKKLAEVLSSLSSINDIINAVIEDDDKVNSNFIKNTTRIIQSTIPSLRDTFKDEAATRQFFKKARNFLPLNVLDELKDFNRNLSPDININSSICLPKEEQQAWVDRRKEIWESAGLNPEAASEAVNEEIEKARKCADGLMNVAIGTSPSNMRSTFSSLSKTIDDEINKDRSCENVSSPQEIAQEEKVQTLNNQALEKINLTFIEDLIEPSIFPNKQNKGLLSKILSDKYSRNMKTCTFLKTNFFTKILMTIGVIPKVEFPETIGKEITSKIMNNFNNVYAKTEQTNKIKKESQNLFFSILPSISLGDTEISIKKPDFILTSYNEGTDVEYIDHTQNSLDYKIKISKTDDIYTSRNELSDAVVDAYPNLAGNRSSYLSALSGVFAENYQSIYDALNKDLFEMFSDLGFGEDIVFGYPDEVEKDDVDAILTAFQDTGITSTKDLQDFTKNFSIDVLDPEIYGGTKKYPKIYINQTDLPEGYYKKSFNFYNRKSNNKLEKTILFCQDIAEHITKTKNILKTPTCMDVPPEILKTRMFEKAISKQSAANIEGSIKLYIRCFLSEFIVTALPIIEKVGMNFDNIVADYVIKKMENLRLPLEPNIPSIYSAYVTYLLILEMNAQKYFRQSDKTSEVKILADSYEDLNKEDILNIKTSIINKQQNTPYKQYLKGFHVISFGKNGTNVYNSNNLNVASAIFSDIEIKFANKIGFLEENKQFLETLMIESIKEEMKFYSSKYSASIDIYSSFLSKITGVSEPVLFSEYPSVNSQGWNTVRYFKLQKKNGTTTVHSESEIIDILSQDPQQQFISDLYGNAKSNGKYYTGTIGLKFGVALRYGVSNVLSFEQDLKDQMIKTLLDAGVMSGVDVPCHVRELYKTTESELFFDNCLQIKKIPSICAIYMLENLEDAVNQNVDERINQFIPSVGNAIDFIANSFLPKDNFIETKKEILDFFLSNYIREFYDPSKKIDESFFDFKIKEKIVNNFDLKNLALDFFKMPTISQQLRILDNIELDENGKPLLNKFLSTFMEEE